MKGNEEKKPVHHGIPANSRQAACERGDRSELKRRGYYAIAIGVCEILDDVIRLIHGRPGVRVFHVREHGFATLLDGLWAEVRSILGAWIKEHVQIEVVDHLPDLLAKGAGIKLVDYDELFWSVE
jgi:hypothetical protein